MELPSPWDLVAPADEDLVLFWAAQLATLYAQDIEALDDGGLQVVEDLTAHLLEVAARDPSYPPFDTSAFNKAVQANSFEWRTHVHRHAQRCDPYSLRLWLADLCASNPSMDEGLLGSGVLARRLDGFFDLVDVPFCVSDVQMLFAETAIALAENKVGRGHQGAVIAGNLALGAAGGWFGVPGAGKAGQVGTDYFLGRISKVDDTAETAARLLVSMQAVLAGDDCNEGYLLRVWGKFRQRASRALRSGGPSTGWRS